MRAWKKGLQRFAAVALTGAMLVCAGVFPAWAAEPVTYTATESRKSGGDTIVTNATVTYQVGGSTITVDSEQTDFYRLADGTMDSYTIQRTDVYTLSQPLQSAEQVQMEYLDYKQGGIVLTVPAGTVVSYAASTPEGADEYAYYTVFAYKNAQISKDLNKLSYSDNDPSALSPSQYTLLSLSAESALTIQQGCIYHMAIGGEFGDQYDAAGVTFRAN